MIPESLFPLANHLWQSTLFAAAAWLLTLVLRGNSARVRHWVWVVASIKFLIPFSLLLTLGAHIPWRTVPASTPPALSHALDQAAQPFAVPEFAAPPAPTPATNSLPPILWTLWACGFLGIAGAWLVRWRRIASAVRAGSFVDLGLPIRAVSSPAFIEPGVFGALRPTLLLPEGIRDHLTPEQWKAVVAHELCHVKRRDNLIALMQMLVETVFWFHPLTWWVGKRISEERERACDEEVLKLGNEPRVYARGILKVCELYLESPIPCVAGVSGSNLRMRIEAILNGRIARNLNVGAKALLAAAGLIAIAAPILIGLLHGVTLRAQTVSPELRFDVASVKAIAADGRGPRSSGIPGTSPADPGRFYAHADVLDLVITAYDIPLYRLSETQDLYLQKVEVQAKMPVNTTRGEFNVMLQNLLADRLNLKVHWAAKDIDGFALVVAKGGPKLKPSAPDSDPASDDSSKNRNPAHVGPDGFPLPPPGNGQWTGAAPGGRIGTRGHNQTAAQITRVIQGNLGGPLTDSTGLTGKYDYTIFWSMNATMDVLSGRQPPLDPDGLSIFEAVQQQLGLKIEKKKVPVQMLVVDHVDRTPAEN